MVCPTLIHLQPGNQSRSEAKGEGKEGQPDREFPFPGQPTAAMAPGTLLTAPGSIVSHPLIFFLVFEEVFDWCHPLINFGYFGKVFVCMKQALGLGSTLESSESLNGI